MTAGVEAQAYTSLSDALHQVELARRARRKEAGEPLAEIAAETLDELLHYARMEETTLEWALCESSDTVEALECFGWVQESLQMGSEQGSNRLWMERFEDAWSHVWHAERPEAGDDWDKALRCARDVVSQAAGVEPAGTEWAHYDIDTDEPGARWIEVAAAPDYTDYAWRHLGHGAHSSDRMLAAVRLYAQRSAMSVLHPKTLLASGMAYIGTDGTVEWAEGPRWEPEGHSWVRTVLADRGIAWSVEARGMVVAPAPEPAAEMEMEL